MPKFIEQLKTWAAKSFRLGPAIVQPSDQYWGKDPETFNPEAYGKYLATSTGVYACATLRAENLASVPLRLYRGTDPEDRETVTDGALFELLAKVNPFWTLPFLIEMTELALSAWGEAFWVLERGQNGRGVPTEIWWASPDKMRPIPHPVNYLSGYVFESNGSRLTFTPEEVVWLRTPNPIDEYEGLSPLAAARLSIDLGTAGLQSNKKLFDQGMQLGGIISPKDDTTKWGQEQVKGLEAMLGSRFRGVDKAHKWAVLSQTVSAQAMGVNPKDAEFLGQMRWSLGDVCRVYKVSPILVQDLEHATYSNFDQALKALYVLCLIPQARRIEGWLREQLLPMFPGEADSIEFDFSGVAVLQEAEDSKWTREQGQITAGAITINEWRKGRGMSPVPWGEVPAGVTASELAPQEPDPLPKDDGSAKSAAARALKALKAIKAKAIEFGSDEHKTAMKKFDRKADRHLKAFKEMVSGLFEQQQAALLADVRKASKAIDPKQPFDIEEWRKLFMAAALKRIEETVQDAGDSVYDELSISTAFDVRNPKVTEFIQQRAQRFAEEVNATTWDKLKASLAEGEAAGESIDEIAKRVTQVMGDRVKSSAETIARTETISALSGGALEAAKASGVVSGKQWLAALDDRTRESHIAAHEQYQTHPIPLDEDFIVGGSSGPGPGLMSDAAESINCRCSITFEVGEPGKAFRSETIEAIAAWARKEI